MAVNNYCSLSLSATKVFGTLSPQHPLCYAAVLLKFIYYPQFLHNNFAWHMSHTIFMQTVILECINESTNNLYHTMTVLLEYIYPSLEFSINA